MQPLGDELVGKTVGGYRVVRRIGRGGMGAVYEAVQESLGRRVALKVLHPHLALDADVVARFRREAEAAARLGHPNIVQVTDFGRTDDGAIYLVMDYLAGRSLADLLRSDGALAPERAAWVSWQVLEALGAAHAVGIVHRDLKPDNVMLVDVAGVADVVKLLDFGIAKLADTKGDVALTQTGVVLGTPAYMAPEQARGRPVDHRVDLYAVGVLLYETLGGRLPYAAESYNALIAAILMERPTPLRELRPSLPAALVALVEHAMAREPEARFQTAHEMAEAVAPFTGRTLSVATRREPRAAVETAETLAVPTPAAAAASASRSAPAAASAPATASSRATIFAILVAALLVAGAIVWSRDAAPPAAPASPTVVVSAPSPAPTPPPQAPPPPPSPPLPAPSDAGTPPDATLRPPTHRAPLHLAYAGANPHSLCTGGDLNAALDVVLPALTRCYPSGPPRDTDFQLDLSADGRVTAVRPYGDTHGPASERACAMRALGRMALRLPLTAPHGTVEIWFTAR